jgi:phasin family protein
MTALNGFANTIPGYDDIIKFHKANLEALIQSNTRLASGFQELSRDFLAEVQEGLDDSASKARTALAAPSMKEVIEIAVDNSLSGYQKLAASSAKLTQQSWKVLSDAIAPVAARMTDAAADPGTTLHKAVAPAAPKRGVSSKLGASAA